ncbi:ABC transporter permease [Mesorhizobium sp. RP14(2022)]|uniref:ABC transporter permease n=1 Tax=Mesorhizobium liriopis TaxID=2953882 RepID=A0ABT1C7M4_9HYPH|nr:ABC transporter permease [Mesorhizobium liriopis]MCO6050161.1 ABC transporter permease [Mesorhizobium liriopis]
MLQTVVTASRFEISITPEGIRRRRPSVAEIINDAKRGLHKTYHILRLELHQSSFGLYLGNLWLLLEPLLQAATYYFLLTVVFRIGGAGSTFAYFFVAVTMWRSHATLVTGAPYFLSIKAHNYVEQGFGLPIALTEVVGNEILLLFVRLAVLGFFLIVAGYSPQFIWPAVLLVAAVQFTFSMAIYVWLSMLGVLVKDSGKFIGHIVWLWWYMSPGLYTISRIPDWAKLIYNLNPFAHLIPAYHSILLAGTLELKSLLSLAIVFVISAVVLLMGLVRLRRFSYSMAQYI